MSLDGLWFPPGSRIVGRATLPEGDIQLGPRRVIPYHDAYQNGDPPQMGKRWIEFPTRPKRGLAIIATVDVTERWGPLLHVSMSYSDHNPSWDEIRQIKDIFYGDLRDAMMVLPKKQDYVNFHPYTFHLWETPEGWGIQ